MALARIQNLFAVVAAVALGACAGGSAGANERTPNLSIQGMNVFLETSAAFARAPDFPARLESTIDASLRYWGGSWSALDGVSLTLVDDPTVPCEGVEALGCFAGGAMRLTTQDPGLGTFACVEETVLVHEIGHAVIGDPDHTDPRWMEMDSLATELGGREGYTSMGAVPCTTYVSVWRHPLGSP